MPSRTEETGGGDLRFKRLDRVRKRGHYLTIQKTGRKAHTKHFLILCKPSDGGTRLGITVTKRIGNAVARNRVKRVLREVFRRNRHLFPKSTDMVWIAKRGAHLLNYDDVLTEVQRARRALQRATAPDAANLT